MMMEKKNRKATMSLDLVKASLGALVYSVLLTIMPGFYKCF